MVFQIDFKAGKPVYLQLVDQVRYAAASGVLRTGEPLPLLRRENNQLGLVAQLVQQVAQVLGQRLRITFLGGGPERRGIDGVAETRDEIARAEIEGIQEDRLGGGQGLARLILDAALSAPAIAIHRLIIAESARFPEVVRAANEQDGTAEAHALVGGLLAREFNETALPPAARDFATQQFLQMVVAIPRRRAMGFGTPMNTVELDIWATQVVTHFLNGCRGWTSPNSLNQPRA